MNENTQDTDLQELFVAQLRDILWAEKQLVKVLPKMAKAAQDEQLSDALMQHQKETEGHIDRLSEIFDTLGLSARAKKCQAMEGLLKEGDEMMEEYADTNAIDAAIIAAGQKVEHYEMATYGTLRAFAARLGHNRAEELLGETLDEEEAADKLLSEIAESSANDMAAAES